MCEEEGDDLESDEEAPDSPPNVGKGLGSTASFGAEFSFFVFELNKTTQKRHGSFT